MSKKQLIAFTNEIKAMEDRKAARIAADMVCRVSLMDDALFDTTRFLVACELLEDQRP